MSNFFVKTRGNSAPHGKPRVYFTSHPDDLALYFDRIAADILKIQDCAIYYAADPHKVSDAETKENDLSGMNLFVVPVTFRLLCDANDKVKDELLWAKEKNLPILPLMMESRLDALYARSALFGERQYLSPSGEDATALSYEGKLKKYLDVVLVNDETAKRVRASFKSYLFLSYRKKDRQYANELIRLIHREPKFRDIAIWYDEFLTPGESFQMNIDKALKESAAMVLLVTPNVLEKTDGKPNFVMGVEYPAARASGMPIFAAEMQKTDRKALERDFLDIPPCIAPDDEAFSTRLGEALSGLSDTENRDSEHYFLMGRAYLDGIDVEVDVERGLSLLRASANAGDPEAMITLGNLYENGVHVPFDLAESRKWNEKAYWYFEETSGANSEIALKLLNQLVSLIFQQGDYERARILCKQCYEKRKKLFGEAHPDTLVSLGSLATIEQTLGNYREALSLAKTCYTAILHTFGETHPDTLKELERLASVYGHLGEYEKARTLCEGAYQGLRDALGEEHTQTLSCMNTLAWIYGELDDWEKQLALYENAYEVRHRLWGETHPETLIVGQNLATAYRRSGMNEKAAVLLEACYTGLSSVLGKTHPNTLSVLNNLAAVYTALEETPKALALAKESYESRCEVMGERHPGTLLSLNNLSEAYRLAGEIDTALALQEKAYTLYVKTLGETHPDTLRSLGNLAMLYYAIGQYERAALLLEATYTTYSQKLGETHFDTVTAICRLAVAYDACKDYEKALVYYQKLVAYYRNVDTTDPQMTASSLWKLATTYLELGYRKRATPILEELLPVLVTLYGENSIQVQNVTKMITKFQNTEET